MFPVTELFFILLNSLPFASSEVREPLNFQIDLNDDPDRIFMEPTLRLSENIRCLANSFYSELPMVVRQLIGLISKSDELLSRVFTERYAQEIQAISKITNTELAKIVALQFLVEFSNVKDSIFLLYDSDGMPLTGRNFDMLNKRVAEHLRQCTIVAHFDRDGAHLGSAIMHLPLVGFYSFAGQEYNLHVSTNRFAISIKDLLKDIIELRVQPLSVTMRLLTLGSDIDDIPGELGNVETAVNAFFCYGSSTLSAVISNNRQGNRIEFITPNEKKWFLVQTNYDRWEPDHERCEHALWNLTN